MFSIPNFGKARPLGIAHKMISSDFTIEALGTPGGRQSLRTKAIVKV